MTKGEGFNTIYSSSNKLVISCKHNLIDHWCFRKVCHNTSWGCFFFYLSAVLDSAQQLPKHKCQHHVPTCQVKPTGIHQLTSQPFGHVIAFLLSHWTMAVLPGKIPHLHGYRENHNQMALMNTAECILVNPTVSALELVYLRSWNYATACVYKNSKDECYWRGLWTEFLSQKILINLKPFICLYV